MNRKIIIASAAVAAAGLVAWYFASPLIAFNDLKSAAKKGDVDRLERLVDFPAVRDSLKSQLTMVLNERMQDDPEMRDNPFAGLAMMMVPAMVNGAVDAYVTPDGMRSIVQGQQPAQPGSGVSRDPVDDTGVKTSFGYSGLDTFRVNVDSPDMKGLSMVMHRQGLFGWELKRIELPDDLLDAAEATPK